MAVVGAQAATESDDGLLRPEDWERYADVSDDVESLKTYKEQVAYILNRYPATRNSDKELWLQHLNTFHGIDPGSTFLSVAATGALPAQTSLTRARAQLQNQYGLYLPTRPEVLVKRQKRQRAYERSFLHLDDMGEGDFTETYLYSDESGVTKRFLIFGYFFFLSGRDNFEFFRRVLERSRQSGGTENAYFHFKDLRASQMERYKEFVSLALETPSARAHLHIIDRTEARGPQTDVLARSYEVTAVATLRALQGTGVIDEHHRVRLVPDKSQDQLFYADLENRLETQLAQRRIHLAGLEPTSSNGAYQIQAADLLTSSLGRVLNSPGDHAKDELAAYVLDAIGVTDPLASRNYANVTITNHGGPR